MAALCRPYLRAFKHKTAGFTLAELLIALAILGVIATFTIPKVLQSQQDSSFKAKGKEVAGMISQAYIVYKQQNTAGSATFPRDLTPYMNYVAMDTATVMDNVYTLSTDDCSASPDFCILLHNGGRIYFWNAGGSFGGTANTNAIIFGFDPDGKITDGTTNGPGKSIGFVLYYNGRINTYGTILPNTYTSTGSKSGNTDPPWFSWN